MKNDEKIKINITQDEALAELGQELRSDPQGDQALRRGGETIRRDALDIINSINELGNPVCVCSLLEIFRDLDERELEGAIKVESRVAAFLVKIGRNPGEPIRVLSHALEALENLEIARDFDELAGGAKPKSDRAARENFLEFQLKTEALEVIEKALDENEKSHYFAAREFLDRLDIYHNDLSGERVLLRVAKAALGTLEN